MSGRPVTVKRNINITKNNMRRYKYRISSTWFCGCVLKGVWRRLYLCSTDLGGKNIVNLIWAKSKVAPLKVISLPRLELCAALLARLASRVIPKLNLPISQRRFWSDSKVELAWTLSPSTRWKTFVAHRVGEMQDLTLFSEWAHVSTLDNPAYITRLWAKTYKGKCDLVTRPHVA